MNIFRAFAVSALVLVASVSASGAHSHKTKTLEIVHPWTFATEPGTQTIAVCMTVKSLAPKGDRLLSVSSPIASKVGYHRGDGVLEGAAAGAQLRVEGRQTLEMSMTGDRFVLTGVEKALWAYDTFQMTLVFERAGRIVVDVLVEEVPGPQPD